MKKTSKLTTRPASNNSRDIEKALKLVSQGPAVETSRLFSEIPKALHKKLKSLSVMSNDDINMRDFVAEALEDLFSKYEKGEGRYDIDS